MSQYDPQGGHNNPYPPNSGGDPYGGGGFNVPPAGPPPKKKGGRTVVIVIAVIVGVCCLGGVGVAVFRSLSGASGPTAGGARPSTSPSPTGSKQRTDSGDGDTVAVGQCVTVRNGGAVTYLDIAPGCAKGTYKVLARHDKTTLTSKCDNSGADSTYKYDSSRISSSYVLCLKKQ